jgi:hypothetical protein
MGLRVPTRSYRRDWIRGIRGFRRAGFVSELYRRNADLGLSAVHSDVLAPRRSLDGDRRLVQRDILVDPKK